MRLRPSSYFPPPTSTPRSARQQDPGFRFTRVRRASFLPLVLNHLCASLQESLRRNRWREASLLRACFSATLLLLHMFCARACARVGLQSKVLRQDYSTASLCACLCFVCVGFVVRQNRWRSDLFGVRLRNIRMSALARQSVNTRCCGRERDGLWVCVCV